MNIGCGGCARKKLRPGSSIGRARLAVATCALSAASLLAQEPAPPASAAPQTPPAVQQPAQGAQVHTGTTSGLTMDMRLENLLADHQYSRVAAQLGSLPPEQAQFYRGILANRSNDLKTSIELLEPLVNEAAASGDANREKLLRKTLAEDYLRAGDLAKAAAAYAKLETRLAANLSADEQDEIEMPVKLLPLAKDNPAMTAEPCDPFSLQVSDDPLGLIDVPVFVDAAPRSWLLDPTAPFNLIDRSTAREVGIKVSDQAATIRTLTGRPIQVHMAVIPRFTIGGRLTLHDMTVFVYDDADYFFPHSHYQVEGVLGYAALSALGSITVSNNATIQVRPAKQVDPAENADLLTSGARFFLDGDQIVVALGGGGEASGGSSSTEGAGDRMFAVDAGGQQTYLTSRYFDEHAAEFNNQKVDLFAIPGMQAAPQPAYVADTVPLTVGKTTVNLHYLRVLTQPVGANAMDDVYGVLGLDALGQLASYTFDYRTMRFSVRGQ